MANVQIIDVKLGQAVEDIISDDVKELTEKNRKDIEDGIERKKATIDQRSERVIKINQQERQIEAALSTCHDHLLKATEPVPISKLLELAAPVIDKPSPLIMRLKTFLRKVHDNEHVIVKCTRGGESCYTLEPFNAQ
jgi:hypothetical protein